MPVRVGYAVMCEQFHPTELVHLASYAEGRGFRGVMATDHFQPWVPAQGQAAHVWNVLTAVADRTQGDLGEDFEGRMVISADPYVHRAHIQSFLNVGIDRVYLHNVGRNQREWIDVFAREVLPKLTR